VPAYTSRVSDWGASGDGGGDGPAGLGGSDGTRAQVDAHGLDATRDSHVGNRGGPARSTERRKGPHVTGDGANGGQTATTPATALATSATGRVVSPTSATVPPVGTTALPCLARLARANPRADQPKRRPPVSLKAGTRVRQPLEVLEITIGPAFLPLRNEQAAPLARPSRGSRATVATLPTIRTGGDAAPPPSRCERSPCARVRAPHGERSGRQLVSPRVSLEWQRGCV